MNVFVCPYRQTFETFGMRGQINKLREECLELVEAIDTLGIMARAGRDTNKVLAHVLDEAGDVLNVIRSIQTQTDAIETSARTKMLRTQVRIKNGYYDLP